jgi:hypothetical protein
VYVWELILCSRLATGWELTLCWVLTLYLGVDAFLGAYTVTKAETRTGGQVLGWEVTMSLVSTTFA